MTIQEYTKQLLEFLTVEPQNLDVKEEGEYVFVQLDVTEDDTGKMIGNHGETIRALQHVISLSFYDELGEKRVAVNVNDYKQKREERAKEMGMEAAEAAIREQQPQDLPPLQSFERRMIHQLLSENPDVFTRSEGEGRDRRLVVYPKSFEAEMEAEPEEPTA